MKITHPYTPRSVFLPLHKRLQRYAVTVAHRRAGKTVAEINDKIMTALKCPHPNPRVAYIAPYYKQAKSVAWSYLKQYSRPFPGTTINESELRVDFVNGGQVRLYGADNPDALRGIYLDDVTLDEYADMNPRLFPEVIRPTLVDRGGRASFIGTPKGRNDFHKLVEYAAGHPDEFLLTILKASETGLIAESELAALRRQMSEDQYMQEFECSFDAALLGAYYGREFLAIDQQQRIRVVPYDPQFPVHTAWDIGRSDDTVIWFYQVKGGEIHVIDYYACNMRTADHFAAVCLAKPYEYGIHWLPHDAVAKTFASNGRSSQELLAAHLGWENIRIVPNLSIDDGIKATRKLLERCYFDRANCYEATELLRQYQREWDDKKKAFREHPRHDHTSHAADALRMLAIAWELEFVPEIQRVSDTPDPWGRLLEERDQSWKVS